LVWSEESGEGYGPDSAPPDLPGLVVHVPPAEGAHYVIGVHPAEGNPQSNESAAAVFDVDARAQVATLAERADPVDFAAHLTELAQFYREAPVLVERNNHGHMALRWLRDEGALWVLRDPDREYGWPAAGPYWHMAFDHVAAILREGGLLLRDEETLRQMAALDGDTLDAPPGQSRSRAVACVLALAAIKWCGVISGEPFMIPPAPLWDDDNLEW
jgi:hypothetical protein